MMNIRIVKKHVASLSHLMRLVLKQVYEPHNMSLEEERLMQTSFVAWSRKTKIYDNEQHLLEELAWIIDADQKGQFDERKALFREHNIDYKKYHRLPEAFTDQDFREGKIVLDRWNRQNPGLAGI